MTKGYSLMQDFRQIINDPKYSNVVIICKDEKVFHCYKPILAARCKVFDALFYNEMGECDMGQISFPNISSSGMEIVLEYIYSGEIKEEVLTKDNIVETYYVADYFQLFDLLDIIIRTVKKTLEMDYKNNYSPELLSKMVDKMPLRKENLLLSLLVEKVSTIPLNTIEFGRLSTTALQHLLSCCHEKETPFATPEYEVFRYSTILVARQISNELTEILLKHLPTLERIDESKQIDNDIIPNLEKVSKGLEPLIKFIDFKYIKGHILTDIIEPLNIVPVETIADAIRHKANLNDADLNGIRGIPSSYVRNWSWDESACGSNLIVEDNGAIVRAKRDDGICLQSIRTKMVLESEGIFEWDVIIERNCYLTYIGVCTSGNLNYENFADQDIDGWVLSTLGCIWHSGSSVPYCLPFEEDGSKVTVHLDMNKRTCAFTVNGKKYPEVSKLNDLPSKLYPVASLRYPGRLRIQLH
ncbi:6214_t:CDS:1 [Funneliformis geosporum]|nr:6214_t:CDS:1 [Funneliformis geosporum]